MNPAFVSPSFYNVSSGMAFHPGSKTVRLYTFYFTWLVSSFG
jgi:hypothetical protein